jgi:histidinol-phosphate aminotransferase
MRALLDKNDKVIIPAPSFAIFYQSAKLQGAEILTPLYRREDLSFPFKEVLDLIDEDVKLLIICNPNNPTGTSVSRRKLIRILEKARKNDVTVLHDEAYFEFSGITVSDLIKEYENLFITRTFSKQFGLASVRAGYILSQKENITQLLKIRGPYDVNMFAKTAIVAALKDLEYSEKYIDEIMKKSKPKLEAFFKKNNIIYFPSRANFILIKPCNRKRIIDNLMKHGILVRPRDSANIEGTIRITVGTLRDTELFINTYSEILRNR